MLRTRWSHIGTIVIQADEKYENLLEGLTFEEKKPRLRIVSDEAQYLKTDVDLLIILRNLKKIQMQSNIIVN